MPRGGGHLRAPAGGRLIMGGAIRRVTDDDTAASQTIRRTINIPERLHNRIQWIRGFLLKDHQVDISYSDFMLHFLLMEGLSEWDSSSNPDQMMKEWGEEFAAKLKKQGWE